MDDDTTPDDGGAALDPLGDYLDAHDDLLALAFAAEAEGRKPGGNDE